MMNFLKKLMPKIFDKKLTFIYDMSFRDNVIVSQEAMHIMTQSKQKNGYMAIKLDFEKTYDSNLMSF